MTLGTQTAALWHTPEVEWRQRAGGHPMGRGCSPATTTTATDPEYHQTAGSVQLVLRASKVDRALDARLPGTWRQAMQVVRDGHRVSTGDVQSALGVSRPAVINVLQALEAEGLIEWIGKSPRDPRAYWQLHIE